MFGKALSSFKTVRKFVCSCKIGDARLNRPERLERAAFHAPHDQQSKYHSSIILKNSIPGIYMPGTHFIFTFYSVVFECSKWSHVM